MTTFLIVAAIVMAILLVILQCILQWGKPRKSHSDEILMAGSTLVSLGNEHFIPRELISRLVGIGYLPMNGIRVIWHEAIQYLWNAHKTYVVIYPTTDDEAHPCYDYDILSTAGSTWEEDTFFSSYPEAATHALEKAISELESLKL